ncbi:MAG TPA: hypothetical protein VHF47_13900 [Acidimicrobiales bacterium]|nr:hypothetical protein [Acidimicrobiales bacterium]
MTEDARPQDIEGTTAARPTEKQTATPGGDEGPARSTETDEGLEADIDPPEQFKEVLEADPVLGGSSSIGEERRPD